MRCKLLLLTSLLSTACGGGGTPAPLAGKSVVLISLDTLRADRLGCYGYERGTSASLDSFAQEGVRFDDVTAAASKTAPSALYARRTALPVFSRCVISAS